MSSNKLLVLVCLGLFACVGEGKNDGTTLTVDEIPDGGVGDADTDADSDADADTDADSDVTGETGTIYVGGSAVARPADRGWRLVVPDETDTTGAQDGAQMGTIELDG